MNRDVRPEEVMAPSAVTATTTHERMLPPDAVVRSAQAGRLREEAGCLKVTAMR